MACYSIGSSKEPVHYFDVRAWCLLPCFLFMIVGCGSSAIIPILSEIPDGVRIVHLGYLKNRAIHEASGLAASHLRSDTLWIINDGGNEPLLYAIGLDGMDRGFVRVDGAENIDWEDLSSFVSHGKPYILIADVGDNPEHRESSTLYIVEEPRIQGARLGEGHSVKPEWRIRFRYEDAPRDCESIGVDVENQRIYLITKRTIPPVLYQLPLFPSRGTSILTAEKVTDLTGITRNYGSDDQYHTLLDYIQYQSAPTAMDIASDGLMAVILTYDALYLFSRTPGEDWIGILRGRPVIMPIPRLYQAEALCFGVNGNRLYLTSEKGSAPLYGIDINRNIVQ